MTLREAKELVRATGASLTYTDGEYCVKRGECCYFTDDRDDAVKTAQLEAKRATPAKATKAERALIDEVNSVIHRRNLYAVFPEQNRRVIDCHRDASGSIVVRDLNDETRVHPVIGGAFSDGYGQAQSFTL